MNVSHVHVGVRDLAAAVQWLEKVWAVKPTFKNEQMASVPFGTFTVIFDSVGSDIPATIGFESFDCDGDYRTAIARGGVSLEPPANKPWGVRAAYVQGPGAIKFEIEQLLPQVG